MWEGRSRRCIIYKPCALMQCCERQAFDLIDAKELAPLQELIDQMAP